MTEQPALNKSRYIAVLTEGYLVEIVKKAIEDEGYEFVRSSEYDGYVTTEYKLKEDDHVARTCVLVT